jgi:hypothetical protein
MGCSHLSGGLEDRLRDFLSARNQREVARLHLNSLGAHPFGQGALEVRIDGAVVRGNGVVANRRRSRSVRDGLVCWTGKTICPHKGGASITGATCTLQVLVGKVKENRLFVGMVGVRLAHGTYPNIPAVMTSPVERHCTRLTRRAPASGHPIKVADPISRMWRSKQTCAAITVPDA